MKGLKVSLESSYAPDTGAKNGLLKAELKTNPATLTIDTVCALTAQGTLCTFLSDNNLRTWILAALWWTPLLSSVTPGGWRVCRCIREAKTRSWSWQSRWNCFPPWIFFTRPPTIRARGSLWKTTLRLATPLPTSSSTQTSTTDPFSGLRFIRRWRIQDLVKLKFMKVQCAFLKVKSGLETGVNLGYTASRWHFSFYWIAHSLTSGIDIEWMNEEENSFSAIAQALVSVWSMRLIVR